MNFSTKSIMGIVNVTPDSFSDGTLDISDLESQISDLIELGVELIDIGGESTGPGSKDVSADEELNRLRPVIDYIEEEKFHEQALFSIDTYKSEVAEYALSHGFEMVNDVTALRGDEKMLEVLMRHQPYVVLMYSKDSTARTTAEKQEYEDVIETIKSFLLERAQLLLEAGFPKEKIVLDPGMGAFVSGEPKYSFEIIDRLSELKALGYPLLVGVSRKSFLGGRVEDRDPDSIKYSKKALDNGASIVRLHNVEMMKNA